MGTICTGADVMAFYSSGSEQAGSEFHLHDRIDERAHWADRYVMWLEGTRGWERDCTASAVFDGVAVPGELVMCSLSRVRQAEVRVYHNTPLEG